MNRPSRAARYVIAAAVAVAVLPTLLAVALTGLIGEPFLRWEYGRAQFPAAPGFTDEERLELASPSTRYLVDPGITEADLAALNHAGEPLYTAPEIQHLVDVRRLVRALRQLGLVAGLVLLIAVAAAAADGRWREPVGRGLFVGALLTVVTLALIGTGAGIAWPLLFVGFHQVFFDAGTWQFPESSGLIRLFPEQFWFDASVVLVSTIAVLAVMVGVAGRALERSRGAQQRASEGKGAAA